MLSKFPLAVRPNASDTPTVHDDMMITMVHHILIRISLPPMADIPWLACEPPKPCFRVLVVRGQRSRSPCCFRRQAKDKATSTSWNSCTRTRAEVVGGARDPDDRKVQD